MKKVFLAIAVASVFTACNNGGETTDAPKSADSTLKAADSTVKAADSTVKTMDSTVKTMDSTVKKMAAGDTSKKK